MHPDQKPAARRLRSADEDVALIVAPGGAAAEAPGNATVVWLVLRGHVRVSAREGDFFLCSRDWLALGPGAISRAQAGPGALLLAACLGPEARPGLLPGRGRLARGERGRALRLWFAHGAAAVSARPESRDADAGGVRTFLASLQAELSAGAIRCPGHSPQRKRQVLLRMQRARLCLEGQPDGGMRIADLAKRVNFSPWYFSKVFHALYGIGPQQFAARMRLERASRLLATTSLPVTEVSAACGFDNPCSFARAFRARFGMSASQHRLRGAR